MPLNLSHFKTRPMRAEDVEAVVRIQYTAVEKAWRPIIGDGFDDFLKEKFDHDTQVKKYTERAADPERILVVVEKGGEIVGFAGARPHGEDEQPPGYQYQGNSFYLLPSAEGTGASLALLDTLLEQLKKRGIKSVAGWCLADNKMARNFYERRGGKLITDAIAPKEYDIAPHVAYGWRF